MNRHSSLPLRRCAAGLCLAAVMALPADDEILAQVSVTERGLFGVTAFDLNSAGVPTDGLRIDEVGVRNLGEAQAAVVEDLDGDGLFASSDRIVFFGQRRRGRSIHRYRYADHNVYQIVRLEEPDLPGPRERARWLGPTHATSGEASPSLQRWIHVERDTHWSGRFAQREQDASDFSFMGTLDFLRFREREYTFDLPAVDTQSSDPFSLVVQLYGQSNANRSRAAGSADHLVEIELNGEVLDQVSWSGRVSRRAVLDGLDASLLRARGNEIAIRLVTQEGVEIDVVHVDWFDVQYPSRPVVLGDRGEFRLPGSSLDMEVEIGGFTSDDIYALCLTQELVLEPEVSADAVGTHTATITAPCDDGIYAFATPGTLLRPASVEAYAPEMPLDPDEGVDLLIITHPDFREAADRLAAHRRDHDALRVLTVDVQDVYDRFNHGLPHPDAIREAVRHIRNEWPDPLLRYVLLFGDASWDWHGVENPGETFIPTHYYPSGQVEYASDNHFVMLEGDQVCAAIGRLPADSPEEANGVVDKLIAYDAATDAGDADLAVGWQHRIIFAASDNPMYRRFLDEAVSTHIEGNFDLLKAYATNASPLNCTELLIDTVNEGVAFVSYVGHGARYVWQTGTTRANTAEDYEANFNPSRIEDLHNAPMLPIVFGITCFTNNFDNPNPRDCIGERLVLSPTGGALACFATSSYSYVHSDMAFCDLLFETLFEDEPERVGDLIHAAMSRPGANREMRRMFILLGDPSARLPLIPLPEDQRAGAEEAESPAS